MHVVHVLSVYFPAECCANGDHLRGIGLLSEKPCADQLLFYFRVVWPDKWTASVEPLECPPQIF